MLESEDMQLAIELKNSHNELRAPINDIVSCIKEAKKTGITENQVRKMVVSIFVNETTTRYYNSPREPNDTEILIYELPEKYQNILKNPM